MGTSYTVKASDGDIRYAASRNEAITGGRDLAIMRPGVRFTVYRNGQPLKVAGAIVSYWMPAGEAQR